MAVNTARDSLRFEVVTPPIEPGLPRMDVAGIVGFCAAGAGPGPEVPVAVESYAEHVKVFGPDPVRGEWRGALGLSVRSFFANGGRRAWIVGVPLGVSAPDLSDLADPVAAAARLSDLRETVNALRDGASLAASAETSEVRRLRGLHALLDLDEVTLLAAPDAAATPSTGGPVGDLASLHRVMLRLAALRGDVICVLTLPVEAGPVQVEAYLTALLSPEQTPLGEIQVPGLAWDEARMLSFGVLTHPWVRVPDADGALRPIPPDGPVLGTFARRALGVGCWAPPANLPLADALGVESDTPPRRWRAWEDEHKNIQCHINMLWSTPRGAVLGRCDTLSPDPDLAPVGARRLVGLLRRLALREGQGWAFEPATPALAGSVRAAFDRHLEGLYHRGALSGARRDHAFEVRVSTSPSPEPRLEVELRVAPSRPLRFLTVRLLQIEHSGLSVEGA